MNWEQHSGKANEWDPVALVAEVSRRALHSCIKGASEQRVHLCCSATSRWDFLEITPLLEDLELEAKGFNFTRQSCLQYLLQERAVSVNKPKSGYFDFSF